MENKNIDTQLKKFEDLTKKLDTIFEKDSHNICVNYGAFMTAANHILRTKLPPYIYGSYDIEEEYGIKVSSFENAILDVMMKHVKMSEDFSKLVDKHDEVVNKFNDLAERWNKIPVDQRENGLNDLPVYTSNDNLTTQED